MGKAATSFVPLEKDEGEVFPVAKLDVVVFNFRKLDVG